MRTILRILAVLGTAILLTAAACDPQSDVAGEGIIDAEPPDLPDQVEIVDDPLLDAETPLLDDLTIEGESDEVESDEVEAEPEAEEDPEPDLTVELELGPAYLEDDLLDTTASMTLDPVSGLVSFTAGAEIRDEGWHGVTLFLELASGSEGEVQCSFRPDSAAADESYVPACNSFLVPNFEPCGSHPFTDSGEGPMTIEGPFHFADGTIVFRPEGVVETCDLVEASIAGGFIGTCDPSFSCRSTLLSEQQLLETIQTWPGF